MTAECPEIDDSAALREHHVVKKSSFASESSVADRAANHQHFEGRDDDTGFEEMDEVEASRAGDADSVASSSSGSKSEVSSDSSSDSSEAESTSSESETSNSRIKTDGLEEADLSPPRLGPRRVSSNASRLLRRTIQKTVPFFRSRSNPEKDDKESAPSPQDLLKESTNKKADNEEDNLVITNSGLATSEHSVPQREHEEPKDCPVVDDVANDTTSESADIAKSFSRETEESLIGTKYATENEADHSTVYGVAKDAESIDLSQNGAISATSSEMRDPWPNPWSDASTQIRSNHSPPTPATSTLPSAAPAEAVAGPTETLESILDGVADSSSPEDSQDDQYVEPVEEVATEQEEPTTTETGEEPTITETVEEPTTTETVEEPTITETVEEPTITETAEEPTASETAEEPTQSQNPEDTREVQGNPEAQEEEEEEEESSGLLHEAGEQETTDDFAAMSESEVDLTDESVEAPLVVDDLESPNNVEDWKELLVEAGDSGQVAKTPKAAGRKQDKKSKGSQASLWTRTKKMLKPRGSSKFKAKGSSSAAKKDRKLNKLGCLFMLNPCHRLSTIKEVEEAGEGSHKVKGGTEEEMDSPSDELFRQDITVGEELTDIAEESYEEAPSKEAPEDNERYLPLLAEEDPAVIPEAGADYEPVTNPISPFPGVAAVQANDTKVLAQPLGSEMKVIPEGNTVTAFVEESKSDLVDIGNAPVKRSTRSWLTELPSMESMTGQDPQRTFSGSSFGEVSKVDTEAAGPSIINNINFYVASATRAMQHNFYDVPVREFEKLRELACVGRDNHEDQRHTSLIDKDITSTESHDSICAKNKTKQGNASKKSNPFAMAFSELVDVLECGGGRTPTSTPQSSKKKFEEEKLCVD